MSKQKEPVFTGRDGLQEKKQYDLAKAAHARPIVTAVFSGVAGLLGGAVIAGTIAFGAGYAYSEWANSDEYRVQKEKMWASERKEREAMRTEEARVAEAERKKKLQEEKVKPKERREAEQGDSKVIVQSEKDRIKRALIKNSFSRGNVVKAVCNPYRGSFTAKFDKNHDLTSFEDEYISPFSRSLDKAKKLENVQKCENEFSYDNFIAVRNLSKIPTQEHFQQVRDMMSLCGGVSSYSLTATMGKTSTTISFKIASEIGTMSYFQTYSNYKKCMINSLKHPLIKTTDNVLKPK